jgi:hypothetical protein
MPWEGLGYALEKSHTQGGDMNSRCRFLYIVLVFCFLITGGLLSAEEDSPGQIPVGGVLTLDRAVMCESIEAFLPKNESIIFPISVGKVLCFSTFSEVPRDTVIYHNWYRKDQLISKRKLTLKPPKWSTFSGIQLRETDKGPWRVDITDEQGKNIKTLRFSITE